MEVSTDAPSVSDSQEDEDSYEPDPIRRDGGSEPFTPRWKAEVTPEVGHGGGGGGGEVPWQEQQERRRRRQQQQQQQQHRLMTNFQATCRCSRAHVHIVYKRPSTKCGCGDLDLGDGHSAAPAAYARW